MEQKMGDDGNFLKNFYRSSPFLSFQSPFLVFHQKFMYNSNKDIFVVLRISISKMKKERKHEIASKNERSSDKHNDRS